jgi:hypothetical protein
MPAVNRVAAGTGYFLKNPGNMKARLPCLPPPRVSAAPFFFIL